MAIKSTRARRMPAKQLAETTDSLTALLLLKDYKPSRAVFAQKIGADHQTGLADLHKAEIAAENAYNKARDAAVAAEWELLNYTQGAAEQVAGQYGSDSDEYASLGYKKKSEYKKGTRKPGAGTVALQPS